MSAITPTDLSDGDPEEGDEAGKDMKPGSTTACWRRTLCPFSETHAVRVAEPWREVPQFHTLRNQKIQYTHTFTVDVLTL